MGLLFLILSLLTLAGAVAAVVVRQLIHAGLCLALSFLGLALMYLQLGAQFIGLAQVLVYIGAVAVLIVFAILLTRGLEASREERWSGAPWVGVGTAGAVLVGLVIAVLKSSVGQGWEQPAATVAAEAAVLRIGIALMTEYVVPLMTIAVLLTVALIGAVLIAMQETAGESEPVVGGGSLVPAESPGAGHIERGKGTG
jgi:NADH-quinone oxidoreductase subunit J